MVLKAVVIKIDINDEEDELNHWFSNNKDLKVKQILQKPANPELPNMYLITIIYEEP